MWRLLVIHSFEVKGAALVIGMKAPPLFLEVESRG